jgi:putative hydrolase of the HAD superfamily
MTIKYIVFDLGGVLIDINFDRTFEAYEQITGKSKEELRQATFLTTAYEDYESGILSDNEFRAALRKQLDISVDDKTLDEAWNALLLDFNAPAINLLKELKQTYPLYLLSNTNNIHFERCNHKIKEQNLAENLTGLFNGLFLSYKIGYRKPSERIYQHAIKRLKCLPEEILFIDDLENNIAAARDLGIQTIHLSDNKKIAELVLSKLN